MISLNNRTEIYARGGTATSGQDKIYDFDFLEKVEITSTWDKLTDTATLTLPKKISYKNRVGFSTQKITGDIDLDSGNVNPQDVPVFLQGDQIRLSGGYGDTVPSIFSGYIRAVAPNHPILIHCEDQMYILKNEYIETYSEVNVTLQKIIRDIVPDEIPVNVVAGFTLDSFRISNKTVAEVLAYIKKSYGLVSWFRDGTLNVGLAYLSDQPLEVTIHEFITSGPRCNVITPQGLEYKTKDQAKIRLKVVSIFSDNTKKEIFVGPEGAPLRTIHLYGVQESAMQRVGEETYNKLVFEGYTGSFETFLLPLVKHGDAVKLSDPEFEEREGVYLVKEVVYSYGINGGRQKIMLDRRIS